MSRTLNRRTDRALAAALLSAAALTGCAAAPAAPAVSTPLAHVAGETRFGVIGDSGSGNANQQAVARALTADGPYQGIIHTGDVLYPDGNPDLIPTRVDQPYAELLRTATWLVAPGNHDEQNDHAQEMLTHFGQTHVPYRTQIGPVAVYVLDSFQDLPGQAAWITRTATTDTAPFKIAVAHLPAQSCSKHSSDPATTTILEPALEAAHFTLFLTGHDHNYQRFTPTGGLTHIVTGGGGADLYALKDCPAGLHRVTGAESFHYLVITASPTHLTVTARTPEGTQLDRFTLTATR